MILHRMVNGVRVDLTPEEVVERQAEGAAALAEQAAYDLEFGHVDARRKEYPPVGDQLEIILNQLGALPNKTSEFQALLDEIAAVKAKYPKQV